MTPKAWSNVSTSRNPPTDIDLSEWKSEEIGDDIYGRPVLIAYWFPRLRGIENASRKAYDVSMVPAQKAYDEAERLARKAYGEAVGLALKAYDEAMAPARKAYDEAERLARKAYAKGLARKAYDEAERLARKAYGEAMAPAWKAFDEAKGLAQKARDEAQARAVAKHLFHPPAMEYVLYRSDEDVWFRTVDANEAGRLLVDAATEMRIERERLQARLAREREFAKKGVTLARFDPRKVFVRRHARRQRL